MKITHPLLDLLLDVKIFNIVCIPKIYENVCKCALWIANVVAWCSLQDLFDDSLDSYTIDALRFLWKLDHFTQSIYNVWSWTIILNMRPLFAYWYVKSSSIWSFSPTTFNCTFVSNGVLTWWASTKPFLIIICKMYLVWSIVMVFVDLSQQMCKPT
jgi:hypothetical protein